MSHNEARDTRRNRSGRGPFEEFVERANRTLLLLVLLENASRRAEEAAQEKLNVIAEAVAALMDSRGRDDPALLDAAGKLRDAVGLEERH